MEQLARRLRHHTRSGAGNDATRRPDVVADAMALPPEELQRMDQRVRSIVEEKFALDSIMTRSESTYANVRSGQAAEMLSVS